MSRKKWPPRIAVTDFTKYDDDSFWCAGSLSETRGDYISKDEHQAILSEEQRLNAIGQERELALMAKVADLEKRLLVAKEALKFYSRTGGASDTNDRKGCWILARRFIFGEAIAHDFEKIPYGETGTEYLLAGKRAREAIAAIEKGGGRMGGMLKSECRYCRRPFTEQEQHNRVMDKKDNIKRSREKAKANGKSLGRKRKTFIEDVLPLRLSGLSIREIAKRLGVSTTPIQRCLQEIKQTRIAGQKEA